MTTVAETLRVEVHEGYDPARCLPHWERAAAQGPVPLSRHPAWLAVCQQGLQQVPYVLEATAGGKPVGILPLCYLRSVAFGRFLVGMPYLNYGGALAHDPAAVGPLIDRAVQLADELRVRFLELRHEQPVPHPALVEKPGAKVHMRLALPADPQVLWKRFKDKVRNQVRKGQKADLTVAWGGRDQLPAFYEVFCRNMRDLGTPVYGSELFGQALDRFPDRAELCVARAGNLPVAGAILLHGQGVTEVPSASSLRSHNHTSANMLLYWNLLERAVRRGQSVFDFGRSSPDSPTHAFKKQWGAEPHPATWQYYLRGGSADAMRPDNPKYRLMIRVWKRLPVWFTRRLGPHLVRGIP